MALTYNVIEIFTSEDARWQGKALSTAILEHVAKAKIAARCMVSKGVAGCYENGEVATSLIEVLSFNMPLKIEVILPAPELETVLPGIEEMVTDGIVVVEDMEIRCHKTKNCLIPRQIKVKDVMTASPKSVRADTPVSDVIKTLVSSSFNGIPVVDAARKPIGIITQGDLIHRAGMPVRLGMLNQLANEKTDAYVAAFSDKAAGAIMSKPAVTVREDDQLVKAVDVMLTKGLKRLPVVNDAGVLTGMLARIDVFMSIAQKTPDWKKIQAQHVVVGNLRLVGDVMRHDAHTVFPETPIEDILRSLSSSDIQRMVVVDHNGRLLGIIADRDLLGLFSAHRDGFWEHLVRKLPFAEFAQEDEHLLTLAKTKTAADAMKTDLVTVCEDTSIDNAINIMASKGIKRLPVINRSGIFMGMISRDSLLRTGAGT